MDGHSSSVQELCISSDGLQLVTGSKEEIIRWDLIYQQRVKDIHPRLLLPQQPQFYCSNQIINSYLEIQYKIYYRISQNILV
ncbi:unnamed protein product [Paramecium octaurelia]|uniref:Uncharacterized protein n=1 Tax=Paramecium octaurelia TaxID=43137 RepID=A0A8S1XA55_PAROT|nr:unnamed protein product [Paramecium octaurelia]